MAYHSRPPYLKTSTVPTVFTDSTMETKNLPPDNLHIRVAAYLTIAQLRPGDVVILHPEVGTYSFQTVKKAFVPDVPGQYQVKDKGMIEVELFRPYVHVDCYTGSQCITYVGTSTMSLYKKADDPEKYAVIELSRFDEVKNERGQELDEHYLVFWERSPEDRQIVYAGAEHMKAHDAFRRTVAESRAGLLQGVRRDVWHIRHTPEREYVLGSYEATLDSTPLPVL